MSNLFYYNNLLYTHLQLDPSVFYTPTCNNSYIFIPLLESTPSFLEFQSQPLCTQTITIVEPQEAAKVVISLNSCTKSRQSVKSQIYRKQEDFKQDQSEEFKVKEVKTGLGITYKKKNTQSNIVNQTFSYLSSQRSKKMVAAFFKGNENQANEYYRVMTKVKQINKKYINRKYLKRLIQFSHQSQFFKAFLKSKVQYITAQNVQKLLRALTFHFLRENSVLTLLTSSKIYKQTLPQHFWRKREIISFFFEDGEIKGDK